MVVACLFLGDPVLAWRAGVSVQFWNFLSSIHGLLS